MRPFAPMLAFAAMLRCTQTVTIQPPAPVTSDARVPFVFETSAGVVHCEIDAAHAPHAAAMVIRLATARAPFRDPVANRVVTRPYYDGLSFFRAIPNVLVQTGCLAGDGSTTPGYRIAVETSADDAQRLARPGVLLLARYQPPPNRADPNPPPPGHTIGAQLVIALDDMSHLAGEVTVLGSCVDLDVVRRIAGDVAAGRGVTLNRAVIRL